MTLGFEPNVKNLSVEKCGLTLNEFNSIDCDEYGMTTCPSIYIVGDAQMPFAAVFAKAKAKVAALHALGQKVNPIDDRNIPLSFHENPQVSTVGNMNGFKTVTIDYTEDNFKAYIDDRKKKAC
ncbi:FAD-dependent oxidoreductase [Bacillus carboniphilus]|uniref:FAD-dependent oxidoreductase n=1 Tax=Bacillus carboniphilus TaxID=86663 RepID=A0ABY9K393_9BACI|nr:FAD-dependent oxidoreductase [Bacillus carboniphilus]WLR44255.1 FAD-dependent oxidoreductase [Bacillus carboniphilus]